MTRDEKIAAYEVLREVRRAVEAVNGSHREMVAALRAVDEAESVCLGGDEVFSQCEACDEYLFLEDDNFVSDGECYVCRNCTKGMAS